jgi:hypothetical protein
MYRRSFFGMSAAAFVLANYACATCGGGRDKASPWMARGATPSEVRKHQALGSCVIAPDGSFFLYEWSRPYNWPRRTADLPESLCVRNQTLLFRVSTPDKWPWFRVPTSTELIPPQPGATYYLGSLSPDSRCVAIYEFDWDRRQARAGVVETASATPPKTVWFQRSPDLTQLTRPSEWTSNETLIFPTKQGSRDLVQANAITGETKLCQDCSFSVDRKNPVLSSQSSDATNGHELPKKSKLMGRSANEALAVYSIDTPDCLALLFTKSGRTVTLFENDRH